MGPRILGNFRPQLQELAPPPRPDGHHRDLRIILSASEGASVRRCDAGEEGEEVHPTREEEAQPVACCEASRCVPPIVSSQCLSLDAGHAPADRAEDPAAVSATPATEDAMSAAPTRNARSPTTRLAPVDQKGIRTCRASMIARAGCSSIEPSPQLPRQARAKRDVSDCLAALGVSIVLTWPCSPRSKRRPRSR